jgi:hypothetical protein
MSPGGLWQLRTRRAGSVNLYQYAGNNPASYTDPFGLCPPKLIPSARTTTKADAVAASEVWAARSRATFSWVSLQEQSLSPIATRTIGRSLSMP